MRTTPKISITLEGNTWQDILREMSIIEASVRGSRIDDLPDEGIVAPDERSYQDGPICAYCDGPMDKPGQSYLKDGRLFCCKRCSDRFDYSPTSDPRIEDNPGQPNIAKDCQKCHSESLAELASILKGGYGLGPDEVYDILERVR